MYEVELKVEVTNKERQDLIALFKKNNFPFKGVTPQNDFYIEAKESPYGGYDLKRYRDEGDKFIYTEKIWEMVAGQPARKENEHGISKDEFQSVIARFPKAVKLQKQREWFSGVYDDRAISITIDNAKFDHSPAARYFIEAEIDVENKDDVPVTKKLIQEFLKEFLHKSDIIEAPGMFAMVFKKL